MISLRHRNMLFTLFFGVFILSSCSLFDNSEDEIDNAWSDCDNCEILFIGSSYLDYGGQDVIDIFEEFVAASDRDAEVKRSVYGGHRLYNHLENSTTLSLIDARAWDFIILQGNSAFISQEKWHDQLIPYLTEFREIIKTNNPNTTVIYMMPWAYLDGLAWMEGETDTYADMQKNIYSHTISVVKELDIATAPVGWAWYSAYEKGYRSDLYTDDDNHQGPMGAYLAAATFYTTVYQEYPEAINFYLNNRSIQDSLHHIAFNTVGDNLKLWNIY